MIIVPHILINENHIAELVSKNSDFKCNYFYCSIRLLFDGQRFLPSLPLSSSYPKNLKISYFVEKMASPEVLQVEQKVKNFSVTCSGRRTCQKVFDIEAKNVFSFVLINQTKMIYTGWKVPGCFYGGMTFYNKQPKYQILKEMISCCENSANKSTPQQRNAFGPYNSATRAIRLVVYYTLPCSLSLTFSFSNSHCKGIFLNPCQKNVFPLEYKIDNIDYTLFWTSITCFTFHMGLAYFTAGNYASVYGCFHNMHLGRSLRTIEKHVKFSYMNIVRQSFFNHYFPISKSVQEGDLVLFSHIVTESSVSLKPVSQLSCSINAPPATLFHQFLTNSSDQGDTIFNLEVILDLNKMPPRIESYQFLSDHLMRKVPPFSESVSILTLEYMFPKGSEHLEDWYLYSPLAAFSEDNTCPIIKVKESQINNLWLVLRFSGNLTKPKCFLGKLKVFVWLCLSDQYFKLKSSSLLSGVFNSTWYYSPETAPKCPRQHKNLGEDLLLITLNITTDIVQTLNRKVEMRLPGKVVGAKFHAKNSGDSSCSVNASMRVLWEKACPHFVQKSWSKMYLLVSRNTGKQFFQPVGRTWYQAIKMCQEAGLFLPKFTSETSMDNLIVFLQCMSEFPLVQSIFIGIYRNVSTETKYRKAWTSNSLLLMCLLLLCLYISLTFKWRGDFKWTDGSPVTLHLWGPPHNFPKPKEEFCLSEHTSTTAVDQFDSQLMIFFPFALTDEVETIT